MGEDHTRPGSIDRLQVFHSLYLHMAEGVALYELVCDDEGEPINYRVLDANPQFRRYIGGEAERIVGKLATELFHTGAPPYLAELAAAALAGQPTRFELRFAAFDKYFEVSAVPLGDGRFATILLDVSERERSEKALRESEWFLRRSQAVGLIGSYRLDIPKGAWSASEALNDVFGIGEEFPRNVEGWLALVHPDDREGMARYFMDRVVGKGEGFDRRYRIVRRRDGAVRWVHGLGEIERDAGGKPVQMIGTIQDVTESMCKEEALRESEERFRRIFELIPGPVTLAETDGTILNCNDAFCQAAGLRREEIVGNKTSSFSTWVDPEIRQAMYDRLAQGKTVEWIEFKMRRLDGQQQIMQIFALPFELGGKKVILSAGRDVTEQRSLEQQMLHSQKLESLGVLAGGIAHDFNNLLTGILGNADLAKTELSPFSPSRDCLEGIETAARRAADLCRQLLAYSGRGRFVVEAIGLPDLVEEMGHLLSISISKRVSLRYDFAASVPFVEADATQIRQVIMNLIVNASEAIGDRDGLISISVGQTQCDARFLESCFGADGTKPGHFVYLDVVDTGWGMDKITLDRIFDPFFSTKFTGRGLGLAAVLGIMRGHHGAIWVQTEIGQGTTFRLLFPAGAAAAPKSAAKRHIAPGYHGRGTILLADDEDTIRSTGRRMLQRAGFEVVLAADGREAIEKFAQHRDGIDLVVLDLTMPHADGETCCREMKSMRPSVKIILSSGYNEQDIVDRFAGTGLDGFVQKPYTMEGLLGKIREVLAKT
jgi:PAS domain S-box-containing protein